MPQELSQETYRTVFEAMPAGVYLVDRPRRILLRSRSAEEQTGYLRQEVAGRPCRGDLLVHCDDNDSCVRGVGCPTQQTMLDGEATLVGRAEAALDRSLLQGSDTVVVA